MRLSEKIWKAVVEETLKRKRMEDALSLGIKRGTVSAETRTQTEAAIEASQAREDRLFSRYLNTVRIEWDNVHPPSHRRRKNREAPP